MTIGREVGNDILLRSPQISRVHAKLFVAKDYIIVEDLESTNGTFVNGEEISSRTAVRLGDHLSFDEISFRLTSVRSGDSISNLGLQNLPQNPAPTVRYDKTKALRGLNEAAPNSKTIRGRSQIDSKGNRKES